ncbi:MAG: alpha/beta fold hydrolase [Bacteroidota bacterium]
MKHLLAYLIHPFLIFLSTIYAPGSVLGQTYTTTIDTFYVQTPEYSASIGLDSLYFPSAITTPSTGSGFPILILVHGTSALDKDANSTKDYREHSGANYRKAMTRMFHDIADSLSRKGIMVLRYDKRSYTVNCIEKPACWFADTISPYDYIKDIHHAIDFAKTLSKVDTCNIFLAGHSQGGSFVSLVGYERNDIRGVLNMAGTALPVDSVAIYQFEHINNDLAGANILRQQFDLLRQGLWPMTDTLYQNHFSPRFWLDWISHTDSAVFIQKNLDIPTALMYGTADRFAPSSIHYQMWQDSIMRPDVTFQLFQDIDHGFGLENDSSMSPEVLDIMADWIHDKREDCMATTLEMKNGQADFFAYPNPVNDILIIRLESNRSLPFNLIDIHGKIIIQGTLLGQETNSIDLSSLGKGLYLLKAGTSVQPIIKE